MLTRRMFLMSSLVSGITPMPLIERRVGLAYSLWHSSTDWLAADTSKPWGTPLLGYYKSDDVSILSQHASWISEAGVDFVFLDWSNDLNIDIRRSGGQPLERFIESSSIKMFDIWATLSFAPRIAIMIGNPQKPTAMYDGRLRNKANEVYELFVENPTRSVLLEMYNQKPLLIVWINTPADWQTNAPDWQDDRFTVRFMTGFITEQSNLRNALGISRYGFWSWEDREQPTYSLWGGHPECMTVTAAWRGRGSPSGTDSPGRQNGRTYLEEWAYARKVGPKFVLAGTFNEWWSSEQPTPEVSKDIEPSKEFGWLYMDILKEQAKLFKSGL